MRTTMAPKAILDDIGIKTATFTAATTDIITATAHALKDRDLLVLTTTGTLPAGLALATVYVVQQATTNTFELINKSTGASVDVTDTGTGTHTWTMHDVGWSINVNGYKDKEVSLDTDGGGDAAMVLKFQGSYADTEPDFSAAASDTNQWEYLQTKDLNSGTSVGGDTGYTLGGSDDHRIFNIENNAIKWINCIISTWTAGEVTVKVKCATN